MIKKIKLIAIFTYVFLAFLILDIEIAPIIINTLITDIVTLLLFSAIIISLVYCSFRISKLTDIIMFIPAAIMLVFLIRAIPNIILDYPPLADPYYHFICTDNIIEFGTIQSHLSWWYPQSEMQLNWPLLHILTTQLTTVSGIDVMFFYRFLMPYIGIVFFLGIFVLAYSFINNYGTALLAGLIGSISSTVIFYQSEYHPQALALALFVFILIGFFKTRSKGSIQFAIISLVFVFSFTLSHHFSTLFLALICILLILLSTIIRGAPIIRNKFNFLSLDVTFLSLVVITIFGFYVYTNPDLLRFLINWSVESTPISGGTERVMEPIITTIINSAKWVPILIVLLASPYILKYKNIDIIRLLTIASLIFMVGIMGLFLFFMPLDRLFAFSMPIIGIISSIVLFKLARSKVRVKKILFSVGTIAISLTLIASIFGSQSPAYFFKSSEPNEYYLYNNNPPNAFETSSSGKWSIEHIEYNSTYGVTFSSWTIPFYYGKNPIGNIGKIGNGELYSYIIINKNVQYDGKEPKAIIEKNMNKINSGPSITFYSSQSQNIWI